jgi:hypothetical protein
MHLAGDLLDRAVDNLGVREDEVDAAQADRARQEQVTAEAERERGAEHEQRTGRGKPDTADDLGQQLATQELVRTLVEAPHDVTRRSAGADVLGAGQAFLEEPNSSALACRAAAQYGTATSRRRVMAMKPSAANRSSASATRPSICASATSRPTTSRPLPITWTTKRARKLASALASPSTRSMSSPGV